MKRPLIVHVHRLDDLLLHEKGLINDGQLRDNPVKLVELSLVELLPVINHAHLTLLFLLQVELLLQPH